MHPVLDLFSIPIRSWGLLGALACLIFLVVTLVEAHRRDIALQLIVEIWPWTILAGVYGAHFYYLIAASQKRLQDIGITEWLDPTRGSAVQGGLILGGLAAVIYLRQNKIPVMPVLDVFSPGGALAQACTRVGCFMAGCCYGRPTNSWFGTVYLDRLSNAPINIALHPAQLYEAGLLFLLGIALHFEMSHRRLSSGIIFAHYLFGYGLIRFLVQFFRGDDLEHLLLGLTHSQYTAAGMMATGLVLRHYCLKTEKWPSGNEELIA